MRAASSAATTAAVAAELASSSSSSAAAAAAAVVELAASAAAVAEVTAIYLRAATEPCWHRDVAVRCLFCRRVEEARQTSERYKKTDRRRGNRQQLAQLSLLYTNVAAEAAAAAESRLIILREKNSESTRECRRNYRLSSCRCSRRRRPGVFQRREMRPPAPTPPAAVSVLLPLLPGRRPPVVSKHLINTLAIIRARALWTQLLGT